MNVAAARGAPRAAVAISICVGATAKPWRSSARVVGPWPACPLRCAGTAQTVAARARRRQAARGLASRAALGHGHGAARGAEMGDPADSVACPSCARGSPQSPSW